MRQFILCFFILFVSSSTFSQNSDTTITIRIREGYFKMSLDYSEDPSAQPHFYYAFRDFYFYGTSVIHEAVDKGIKDDQLVIDITFDDKCQLDTIIISKRGKLENFNSKIKTYFPFIKQKFREYNVGKFIRKGLGDCYTLRIPFNYHVR